MTRFTLPAFLAPTLAAPPLSAQVEYDIPDSLAYLKLPRDPAEFVRMVRRTERLPSLMLEMGCPSTNAWVAAVADGLGAGSRPARCGTNRGLFPLGVPPVPQRGGIFPVLRAGFADRHLYVE